MTNVRAKKNHFATTTGRNGILQLSFHYDVQRAKTTLAKQRSEPPLCVQRAVYCEEALADMAYVYIASTSGGMLQGDTYAMDFEMGKQTKAHITTQGATRIYGTNNNISKCNTTQSLCISLQEHAYLEYIPDQIIPYADSEFSQDATFLVHETATLVYSEMITPGRVGMGESFRYKSCNLKMRVVNQNGNIRFIDASKMMPHASKIKKSNEMQEQHTSNSDISSFGIMNMWEVVSSIYIITEKKYVEQLQNEIDHTILKKYKGVVMGGAAIMKDSTGILVRLLSKDVESVKIITNDVIKCARKIILDAPFTGIRKN